MLYTENTTDDLTGILAVYKSTIKFFPYEDGNLQAERLPIKENFDKLKTLLDSSEEYKTYSFDGIIPNNVLKFKSDTCNIVWTSDAKKRTLLFSDALPIQSGTYPVPKLLWKFDGKTLKVFALTAADITENSNLYQAPFLNVSNSGEVCMGTAKTKCKSTNYNTIIAFLENQFFNSYFTHTNTNDLIKGNITSMYLEQQEKKTKSFDNQLLLINGNQTVKNIL